MEDAITLHPTMLTKYKEYFRYGLIKIRVKAIYSKGIGMAFWMLGGNYEEEEWYWPKCGEIDILEITGSTPGLNIGSSHFEEGGGHSQHTGGFNLPEGQSFADDFHTFYIEWDENTIKWYVDSTKYHEFDISEPFDGRRPFNNYFFLILSTGVGGTYSGDPDETSVFPMTAEIDWVRVYTKNN